MFCPPCVRLLTNDSSFSFSAMCCQFWPCCWPLPTKAGEGEEAGQEDIDEDAAEMINT